VSLILQKVGCDQLSNFIGILRETQSLGHKQYFTALYPRGVKRKLLLRPNEVLQSNPRGHCGYPKVALRRWRNNGGTVTFLETAFTSYFLWKVSWDIGKSFLTVSTFV